MVNLNSLKKDKIELGENPEVVNFIESLYKATADKYLKQHKEWYINDRFVRGDHWVGFNKTLNKIQQIPIANGEIRRVVNQIRVQIRGLKNFIKRSQPRWEVHPNSASDEAYKEAELKNKILQNVYRTKQIKKSMTDLIINGLKYSVGFLEGGMIRKDGKEQIAFWVNSSYDILPDPYNKEIDSWRYYFKTFVKPVDSIENNKDYTITNKQIADNREAASDYQNILEKEKYNSETAKNNSAMETAVVKELWLKWLDANDSVKVRVITIIGKNVARVYDPVYRRYPIFIYTPERDDGAVFGQPWIKDLIPLNKSLDKITSQTEGYVQRMLAGKYLIKQGVEVSTITDKGAEKIYYKGIVPPKQLDLPPLPSTVGNFSSDLERWIGTLGGIRPASLGMASGSLQSGKGIEALQSADEGTVAEPIENLELMLEKVGEFVLELIADHTVASETINDGKQDINYIGKVAGVDLENTITIDGSDEVMVTIVPEISYSEEVKQNFLMRLAEAKLIDPKTILEQLKFSNVGDIIQRMEKVKEEDYKQEMMKQRESHRTDGSGPTDSAELADQENMMMSAKQEVPLTPKALWIPEHTQLHMAFIKENNDAYMQNQEAFDAHITAEEAYQQ